jgi:outer membrane protein assembly factor BamB
MRSRTHLATLVLTLCASLGCAKQGVTPSKGLFDAEWQNDGGKSIAKVQASLAGTKPPPGAAVAVGVTPSGLVAVALDGSGKWTHAGSVDARPVIAGDVVVASGGGKVFALDAKSGKLLWSVSSDGRSVRGAGDDGKLTAITLGSPGGAGSLFLAVDRAGSVLTKLEAQENLGQPAVLGKVAFLPWGSQYVSAVDLGSGDELGRLLLREQVSRALAFGDHLWFGEIGLVRFDERIGQAASDGAGRVSLPTRELPGNPAWFTDGAISVPAASSARDRIRLYARPAETDLKIESDRYAATYFKIVMGFSAAEGKLRWVRTFEADVLGGAAARGGFAFCDASGEVRLIAAGNGGDAGKASLGQSPSSCVVQAGGFQIGAGKDAGSLPAQMGKALDVRDNEMAVAQRLLLRELGAIGEPEVTKTLIELASNPRTSPMLLEETRKLLAARRSGPEHMLQALGKSYDFLSDVLRPPPVGPLADALAAMGEKRAAPLLARHLNDPANTPDDVERTARALVKLASASELDELKTFFALYRATADDDHLVRAVLSVAETLLRVGGQEAKDIIERAANDPLTHPDVKRGLTNLAPPGTAASAEAAG